MRKAAKSGPAVLMDTIMILCLAVAAVCFLLYYGKIYSTSILKWTGVVAFTVLYQLWLRLRLGEIIGRLKKRISYKQWWYREKPFEKAVYKALRVKKWKKKVPTFNPELFVLKDFTMEEIANTMSKVETDHWANVLISLSTMLFALIWGAGWIFLAAAVAAILFDGLFIIIQRYNRPRVTRIIERQKRIAAA